MKTQCKQEVTRWLLIALWCALWFGLAAWARFGLVEQAEVAARCDQGGLDFACALRRVVIQAFIHDRLGWLSLGLAVTAAVAVWRGWRMQAVMAGLALAAGCCGLWLYNAEFAAPALLLAATSLVREGQAVAESASKTAA